MRLCGRSRPKTEWCDKRLREEVDIVLDVNPTKTGQEKGISSISAGENNTLK
jgi:hypothetical protein